METKEVKTGECVSAAFLTELRVDYVQLYDNSLFNLQGVNSEVEDEYSCFYFHAEVKSSSFYAFPCKFAGTCEFCISNESRKQYCKQLGKMYELERGECVIFDEDFNNKLSLYFEGQQLFVEGIFFDGVQRLGFTQKVDPTIIPRLLSLLQSSAN